MDAVPGMLTHLHFTPTMTTKEMRRKLNKPDFNYELACAELCGRMHFAMKLIVVVEEQEEFDKWYHNQKSWLNKHPEYKEEVQKKYYSKLKALK
jgi:cytochrome c oxidase subunit 2